MYQKYIFKYGKNLTDANVYFFKNDIGDELIISEKVGKFQNGNKSNYLLFEIYENNSVQKKYIDRKSDEYLNLTNIRPIVDNLGSIVKICSGCGHIVLKENITSAKGDKCIYCDKYACKKCKRLLPLVELNESRLCRNCENLEGK